MKNKEIGVIEKLAYTCRDCYIGRIPFIAVNTYDRKIINLLIEKKNIVDFYQKSDNKIFRLEEDKTVIRYGINFSDSLTDFINFIGGKMRFPGVPHMFALRIAEDKDKRGQNKELFDALIKYIDYFVSNKDFSNCIILYGNVESLPKDIKSFTEIVNVDYPEIWEIKEIAKRVISEDSELQNVDFKNEGLEEIVAEISGNLTGFSVAEIEDIIYKLLNLDCIDGKRILFSDSEDGKEKRDDIIFFKKQQALNYLGGLLHLDRPQKEKADADKIVGFKEFDKWVDGKVNRVKNGDKFARERGSNSVRGLLLFGVPGCGKSASVKVLKEKLDLAVLRMDMGSLMGGYVGDSERNMREALRVAEAMAPCILFVDEIEKGFAATSKGSTGNDSVFLRMFAYMLNWMQEQKNVFIVMTSNDISSLPSEFLRSGRLDGLFSVQMPTASECVSIFKEMMRRSEKTKEKTLKRNDMTGSKIFDESCFHDDVLMDIVENAGQRGKFLIGSDIEKIVDEAKDRETVIINGKTEKIDYSEPLRAEVWKKMLLSVVKDNNINTYGMSENNLYSVARTYINLFHGGFINVSENAMFKKDGYETKVLNESGKIIVEKAEYTGNLSGNAAEYDELLFDVIKRKINAIAPEVEESIIRKLISS